MPGVKILDRKTGEPRRRQRLWECFGRITIFPTDLKDARGAYYAIINSNDLETVLGENAKQQFKGEGFEILPPLEYAALKSVVVRHVDKMILEYTDAEIISSIEQLNQWAKVDAIYKITTNGRLLKIRFSNTEMANKAIMEGLLVLNQRIPARHTEKEVFVKLQPCFNCFDYTHKTRDCPEERKEICANCSQTGHRQANCTETQSKCINCKGGHRTLAAICKVRKELIKKKSREIRDRSRSKARAAPATYAAAATNANIDITDFNISPNEMKNLVAKITTGIVFGQCTEALQRGSFQETVNEFFRLNNLPAVKFPTNIITKGISDLHKDVMDEMTNTGQKDGQTDRQTREEEEEELGAVGGQPPHTSEMEIETDRPKRGRDEKTTPEKEELETKKQRNEAQKTKTQTQTQTERERSRQKDRTQTDKDRHRSVSQDPKENPWRWLRIYLRKSSKVEINCNNSYKREQLRQAIKNNETKIQWRTQKYSFEQVHGALVNGNINLKEEMFKKIEDREWVKMRIGCIPASPQETQ